MLEAKSIIRGDSVGWLTWHEPAGDGVPAVLDANYSCRLIVAGTTIDKAVTDKTVAFSGAAANTAFVAGITPVESLTIAPGQYVVSVKISNATIGFSGEQHGILTVEAAAPTLSIQTEVEIIMAEIAAVRTARAAFMTGGAVKQAWSGRYGNRMTYDNPTLKDYNEMIAMLQRELEAATNVAAGRAARSRIGIYFPQ